jgi:DNA-binding winged helix-turn-helix (wHTH) protein
MWRWSACEFWNGLSYCNKLIRSVLEDDASAPRFIETLTRRGYRFLASIEEHDRSLPSFRSRPTLAVLPFGNLTGDSEQAYFSDELTEELIGYFRPH